MDLVLLRSQFSSGSYIILSTLFRYLVNSFNIELEKEQLLTKTKNHSLSLLPQTFSALGSSSPLTPNTVIQDTMKIGHKYSTVPRAQERVSE